MEMLQQIFELCIVPLLGILTTYLVKALSARGAQIAAEQDNALAQKYINQLTQTICDCVIATNQTYVESLKNKNAFDEAAQKEAFVQTYNAVMGLLSMDAVEYLSEVYGDLDKYITMKIEAEVNIMKA